MLLFNTATKQLEKFKSNNLNQVGIYTCGPTVYHFAHIGNLRSFAMADFLRRSLEYRGFSVNHIINITDVGHLTAEDLAGEDKMEQAAKKEGKTVWEIADFYTKTFLEDFKSLGNLEPTSWVKATDHIQEMIEMIKILEEKGLTYKIDDGIYFDTAAAENYGDFAGVDVDDIRAGERVESNPQKKNKNDFALWKFGDQAEKRAMEWNSPWGIGFPGWHIECSAMSQKYLGDNFDIHTGGIDLIFPHHINEVAQSRGATGQAPANYWMHGEFMLVEGKKMSKSLGNIFRLSDLAEEQGISPLDFRLLLLQTHYRKPLNFTWQSVQASKSSLENLYKIIGNLPQNSSAQVPQEYEEKFIACIEDDLALPQALALFWEALKDKNLSDRQKSAIVVSWDRVFGLGLAEVLGRQLQDDIPEEVIQLANKRKVARTKKDFALADDLRIQIEKMGYLVKDTEDSFKIFLD